MDTGRESEAEQNLVKAAAKNDLGNHSETLMATRQLSGNTQDISKDDSVLATFTLDLKTAATAAAATTAALDTPHQINYKESPKHASTIDPGCLPENWPTHVKYLTEYEYHPSIPSSVLDLVQGRRQQEQKQQPSQKSQSGTVSESPTDGGDNNNVGLEPRSKIEQEYDEIPIGHAIPGLLRTDTEQGSKGPTDPYEIRLITSPPTHPVLGSYGLFATKTLRPGVHLLDYISLVVSDDQADPDSDHTLYLCNDLNLDASIHGNHARFVNDFRNIRTQEQGPNVAWDLYRDAETGQVRMGCKVLKRIQKGEEIVCTYGKAYWKSRGIQVTGEEWEDSWDTDLEDAEGSDGSD
ncbi:hypothetical protein BGW38_004345 [Lunasporangiospora selenospora]|uniref:SET domain-containing protein n=1 Tax=Lunasporangiospora selenospora TaxID=979761 RepID=A0A9P6KHN9_9FUNG|nr:hypothetical protein BGW38_004345 [Lunasporangiospora selenospora]